MLLLLVSRFLTITHTRPRANTQNPYTFPTILVDCKIYFLMFAEPQLCLFQLNSATEDNKVEPDTAACLHAGSGDYHVL